MPQITAGRLALILGALVALGPLAIDTYLPALPSMAQAYGVPIHDVELSVSLYVIGVAIGQWLGGPLSDHFGRKPVAYTGLMIFMASSVLIAGSTAIAHLYVLRILQAIGGGLTAVIAAASVRDHFVGRDAARVLTTIGLIMLLAPLAAPALGALLLHLASWQSIFLALAIYSIGIFLLVRFALPTVDKIPSPEPLRRRMFSSYGRVLRQRQAMGFILANGLAFSSLFTFVTDSAFIYIEYFGISEARFPLFFGANILTMLAMNRLCVVLLRYFESTQIMNAGLVLLVIATATLATLALTESLTLWRTVPLLMLAGGMVALVIPNAIASFLSLFEQDSGAATGLNGTLQFLLAGLAGTAVSLLHDGSPRPMTVTMCLTSLLAWLCYRALARRRLVPPSGQHEGEHQ